MKKRLLIAICTLALLVSAVAGVTAFASGSVRAAGSWSVDETTTTLEGSTFTQTTLGTATTATYSEKLDLKTGVNLKFKVNKYKIDVTQMQDNAMTFEFINDSVAGGKTHGIRLVAHMAQGDRASLRGKILWELYYLNPAWNEVADKNGNVTELAGQRKFGEMYTYRRILADEHEIDVQYILGNYMITVDDCTFHPEIKRADFDLTACTLTVKANSTAETAAQYTVNELSGSVIDLIDGDWMDLGTSTLGYHADGNMYYTSIDEQYSADNPSDVLFLRNVIYNVSGYSVDERIDIAVHYDTSATPAVWWGVGFGNVPFEFTSAAGASSADLKSGKGIMFQTTTGLAEPYYSQDKAEQQPYADNGGGKGYAGEKMLNTISLEIGDETTTVYWNNKPLFENYPLKKTDFKSGKVYPYFRFIESPAVSTKTNTITIRGINTPKVEEEAKTQKRLLSETADQVIPVDGRGNGEVIFCKSDRTPFASSLYTYDSASKTLSVKAEAFSDVTTDGTVTYLIGNKGGYQCVDFIFAEQFAALETPVLTPAEHTLKVGSATEDLTVTAQLLNGEWDGFRGSGLLGSQFSYSVENGVATIVLSKDFLNNLKVGDRKITLTTVSVDGTEKQTAVFTIHVTDESGTVPGGDGDNSGDGNGSGDGDNSGTTSGKKGCKSSAGAASASLGAVALVLGAALLIGRRKKIAE